jgi:predicted ATP-grasp superfamily ATP-dependent carboligase
LIGAVEIVDEPPPAALEDDDVDAPYDDFAAPGALLVLVFGLLEPHPAAINATTGTERRNVFRMC